jgi:long-chain acyl-CoA synthetase
VDQPVIPVTFQKTAQRRGDATAYQVKVAGEWKSTDWTEFGREVREAARAIIALGLQPGESTSIIGFNRPEWTIFYLATMSAAGAPAGVYTTNSPEELQHVVNHAQAIALLIQDDVQWQKVLQTYQQMPSLKTVIMMRESSVPADVPDNLTVLSWDEFAALGKDVDDATLDGRLASLMPEMLATYIYTSGTTGPSKAVMLTHGNLQWTSQTMLSLWDLDSEDTLLSYLPQSHVAEQMFSIHAPAVSGLCVAYADTPYTVADNIKEIRPTRFFGVPRVWERFVEGLTKRFAETTGMKAKLVDWARGVGTQVTDLRNRGQEPSGMLAQKHKLADRLVFSKIKEALGLDRTKTYLVGAAAVAPDILDFMGSLDINIWEIYGLSESCGPVAVNWSGSARFGTVGKPIPGTELELAADGEVLTKGPNIFVGYYKDEITTAETLQDGWMYTGDLGKFDDEGFLNIVGRKKDIIITSGGKNIAPKNIEAALMGTDLFTHAIIIGEGRRYITALLTLDDAVLEEFMAKHGITDREGISTNPELIEAVQERIDEVNTRFARVEQVRNFFIAPHQFSIERG